MPSLREFNERLASMASMRRVTSTMKLVAGSHLHRVQSDLVKPDAFTQALVKLVTVIRQPRFAQSRYVLPPPEKHGRILLVIMSSDRGLCGGFNNAIVHAVKAFHAQHAAREPERIDHCYVGQKAYLALKSEFPTTRMTRVLAAHEHPDVKDSDGVAKIVMRSFRWGVYDEVWMISNHFINSMTNTCAVERLLPDSRPSMPDITAKPEPLPRLIEPNDMDMLENMIYLWVQLVVYYAMLHSATGELAARVMAMENSTMNLNAMEKDLKTRRNRARQAAITNELSEIVSGAEALK